MGTLSVAGRPLEGEGGFRSKVAGHLYLIYTDNGGSDFILSAYTSGNSGLTGKLYIETHNGSCWVPLEFSTEYDVDQTYADKVLINSSNDVENIIQLIDQYATNINNESLKIY